ncbi:MAG: cell division protein FtsI [Blautia sp.]|nr:cell division protein FtsI [Blautia sp.]
MKTKLVVLFVIVLLALILLMGKITVIISTNGARYKKQVMSQAQQKYESRVLPARRGDIYDRNGNILATSNKVYNVILDCKVVNSDPDFVEPTIRALTEVMGISEDDIRKRLTDEDTRNSQYQIIKRQLSMDDKRSFEEYCDTSPESGLSDTQKAERKNIKGIWFEEDYLRIYPYKEAACDTIGFTLSRDTADIGLESYYNSTLMGIDGRQYGYFNGEADVEQTIIDATNGMSIETTLDIDIQKIVEKYVNAFNTRIGAKHVGVIVQKPSTGEILAMDGGDRYDLNDPRRLESLYSDEEIKNMNDAETVEALNEMWSNFCVMEAFEPGSVVKPIVMASALEKGKIVESDTFVCDGFQNYGVEGSVTTIKCVVYPDSHGNQTLGDVIANSCNDGMMQIAEKMGREQFIRTQSVFNFGSRTGIDLPNEATGIIHTAATMGETELACSAFGQGFTCTMIQELNAMCSVINGGYYYQPRLVSRIRDSSKGVVKTYSPILMKQTISGNISADVRSYMQLSVEHGTSAQSKVEGYSSGGKTGTAEKFPRGNNKYLVSFIGFAPVDNPEVLIYVVVDEPNVEEQASSVFAQYIGQGILQELLPYMNIDPDEVSGYVPTTEIWEGFHGLVDTARDIIVDVNGDPLDINGNRVDWNGNRIDEEGYILDANGNYVYDENGIYIKSTAMEGLGSQADGISDTNVPGPLEDDSDWDDGNYESEGLTNEEAGFE